MTVINTNIKSLVARDALTLNNRQLSTAMERLSTGKRINSAADDAAGLSISSRMESQVRGLNMAVKNANDAISVTQTAEGAMQEINDILQRMRELSVQAASDSNGAQDRVYLQDEIAQLSDEIDRIATTTQFNGINVLDGGFSNKKFQIGANAGQTMDITIQDMRASVLGVASSTSLSSVTSTTQTEVQSTTLLGSARGSQALATEARLSFPDANGGTYKFQIADLGTDLSAAVSASLDLNDPFSKQDFVDYVNKVLSQSARNTTATGGVSGRASAIALDVSDSDDYDGFKFAIKIGDGNLENINIRQALRDAGVTTNATTAQVKAALQTELRSVYNDENSSITVSADALGKYFVSDAEGRRIEISQGAGDGTLFGTTSENDNKSIISEASTANGVSAAWDGDDLVLVNASGAELKVHTFSTANYTTAYQMVFSPVSGQSTDELDPVVFVTAQMSSIDGINKAQFAGVVEPTSLVLGFSNREKVVGFEPTAGAVYGTTSTQTANAKYAFDITNGDGDKYFSAVLDLDDTLTDAQVITAVKTALSAGIAANFTSDTSIDMSEFVVEFSENTLKITNTSGRALKIENFESYAGTMSVSSLNEVGVSETLASQSKLFSEVRIGVNPGNFGVDNGSANLEFYIDGREVTAGGVFSLDLDGTSNATLTAFAAAVQTELRTGTDLTARWGGTTLSATHDMSLITVDVDADTNELIIRHPDGVEMAFGLKSDSALFRTGLLFTTDQATGTANKSNVVNLSSSVVQGDVVEATRVTMTLSEDEANFGFKIGGVTVANTLYDATDPFVGSALQTALNTAMDSLNGSHPDAVFEYSVSGREITFLQRDGGEIVISDFTTDTGYETVQATIAAVGNTTGATKVAQQYDSAAGLEASAKATLATKTEAVLTLSGDDLYSMSINDGERDYTLSATVVDISDSNSTQAFTSALETALLGSGISVGMDTAGRVYFTRDDGGEIAINSFTSAGGATATWTPKAGQGDQATLAGDGGVSAPSLSTSTTVSSGGTTAAGVTAISQIDVTTQSAAADALAVIDNALNYVNSERAKLGAIENRLGHTIDNLTNVVTNTEASKSRIVDTDYAVETAELARSQIIQQAATAMLAQANQSSQSVLSLLQ
jgi:flagellin